MAKTHHIVFNGSMDGIVSAAIYIHNIVGNDQYRLYPVFLYIRNDRFPNMIKSIKLKKEDDLLIILDYDNHPNSNLWVGHHFNEKIGFESIKNSNVCYDPNEKCSARLVQSMPHSSDVPKYSKSFLQIIDVIDNANYPDTEFIFNDNHPLMALRAYLERCFTSEMIYSRIVEMISRCHFNFKKAIFQLKIGTEDIDELRREAKSITREMLVVGNFSVVKQRKPNKYPKYSEFFVRPDIRYAVRLTLINSGRYHINIGFNKWSGVTNDLDIGGFLSKVTYLIKGGGHYNIGGGIIEEKNVDTLVDDLSVFFSKEKIMEEEMEKTGVDKQDDPVESQASNMVKTGGAKDIHEGREKAVESEKEKDDDKSEKT